MTLLDSIKLLKDVVVNGSENGFEFYAAGYLYCVHRHIVYVDGVTCGEIHLDQQPFDRDEEYVDVFLTVMEAVRECVRVGDPAFVVMYYMTTDDGLAVSYHVAYDLAYIATLADCRIVATVYPRVLS